ncbi:hypothetical protein pb186bvf_014541 [Paramecium bursaria]
MFQSTPKQNMKPQMMHSYPAKQLQQVLVKEQLTPQKFSIMKNNLKILNLPSQQETSFRSSSQKKFMTSESPQVQNKENGYFTKRISTDNSINEALLQGLQQENKKLNDFIQRQFKEKQEMLQIIDRLKKPVDLEQSFDLQALHDRVERLERVIDVQSNEIEEWKKKYQEACEQDERLNAIDHMESQIMQVVEENERLNNIKAQQQNEIEDLKSQKKHQDQKQKEFDHNYQDMVLKLRLLEENEKDLQFRLQYEIKEKQDLQKLHHDEPSKDHVVLLESLQCIESQLSDLSNQYTHAVIENQKVLRQNQQLREELSQMQKVIDELKGNNRSSAVNPKFQEINRHVKTLREKILRGLQK